MSLRYYANAPATTLNGSVTNVANSIVVTSTAGFPIQYPYTLIIDRGTASEEAVSVTAAAGATLTVTRAIDGTTAYPHSSGATVEHGITAQDIRESNTHVNTNSGVHGVTGSLVGTSDAQALTNKDLTSGTNTFPASLATDAELSAHTGATAAHGATGAVVGTANTQTLTNKNIDLGSNTVTGTKAQFNAAMTDADFATLTGTEALTNKDLSSATNTLPAFVAPVGEVKMFAGSAAPTGYLLCDGTAVSRTTYAALFAVIGTTYGTGDGSTTFNVPNLKGRVPVGYDGTQAEFNALGKTGGEKTHTLTTSEMPSHSHGGATSVNGDHTHGVWKSAASGPADGIAINTSVAQSSWGGVVQNAGNHQHTIGAEGGGAAHNNLQPYLALNYIIRAA